MSKEELTSLIQQLIDTRKEGEWWDFKECHNSNNTDLVHDIICMANQLSGRDGYLVFGVRDKTYDIVGVEKDVNRKNQQQMIDLLKNVSFAGDYRPDIALETIELLNHEIDVLIVFKTHNVPIYLSDEYGKKTDGPTLRRGYIYTRVGDTNTPKNSTADYHRVELLWRKRFGIGSDIISKLNIALDDYENWVFDWGNKKYAYNKISPEFQMVLPDNFGPGWWPLAAFYTAPIMHLAKLNIMVFNTIIYETELWAVDDYGKYIPKTEQMHLRDKEGNDYWFHYYLLDSIEGKMFRIFTKGSLDLSSRELDMNQVLIFDNKNDLMSFKCFYENQIDIINKEAIAEQFKYPILNDTETNGGGLMFSALHVAIAATLYRTWKNEL